MPRLRGCSPRLPEQLVAGLDTNQPRSTQVVALIERALTADRSAPLTPETDMVSVPIQLPQALHRRISDAMPAGESHPGAYAARLAFGQWQADQIGPACDQPGLPEYPAPRDMTLSLAQSRFVTAINQAVDRGLFAPLEGATGTGKGLVLASAAVHLADAGRCVVIASPSHQIGGQTRDEIEAINAGRAKAIGYAVVRGRQEYVSPKRVELALQQGRFDADTRQRVQAWVGRQVERGDDAWLVADAQDRVPDFDWRGACLRKGDDDAGEQAYEGQFQRAATASIVLVTHVMLAQDMIQRLRANPDPTKDDIPDNQTQAGLAQRLIEQARRRFHDEVPVRLPDYDALLVDEAHQLEPMFSVAASDQVSLHSILIEIDRARAAGSKSLEKRANRLHQLFTAIQQEGRSGDMDFITLNGAARGMNDALRVFDQHLAAVVKALKPQARHNAEIGAAHEALSQHQAALGQLARMKNNEIAWVSYSPAWRYPSVHVGPNSMFGLMARMWARMATKGGGAAVSATISLPDKYNRPTPDYVLNRAHLLPAWRLPEHSKGEHRNNPDWVYDPVTLHRPTVGTNRQQGHPWLPPTGKSSQDETANANWAEVVADTLAQRVLPQATGGTLILNTSYLVVDLLGQALAAHPGLADRVLTSDPNRAFASQVGDYLAMARRGDRPVWLSVGRAWTGLDLRLADAFHADEDPSISDLVIPRLPFGHNQTHSQKVRLNSQHAFHYMTHEMLIALRQGMGRLVRQPGVSNRHVWILDPRVSDRMARYHQRLETVLSVYPHQADFDPA